MLTSRPSDPSRTSFGPPAELLELRVGDPRIRLLRSYPGERQHRPPELAERFDARIRRDERKSPVPDRERSVRTGDVRPTLNRVEAGPNAPQLIRLVQHPFVLETVRCRTDPSKGRPQRIQIGDQVREPHGRAIEQALDEGRRLPFPKPTDVHPEIRRPARAPLSAWLRPDHDERRKP